MYSSQTEISIIDNTQHSLLFFHYGFIYIIVGLILCGIGYTFYTKINQLLKDLNEKYDVQLKNNVIDFNIKIDTMEIKYQTYIQKLETQIKRFEGKVDENNDYITNLNIKIDTMKNKTETIVNDFNIKIEKLDFQVEHFKNMGQETNYLLSISTDKNIELINNTQKELNIIKTQIVDMKDTVVTQDQFQRLESQTRTNTNDADNYIKLISNYVTKSKLQDLLVGYATQQELDEVAFECGKFEENITPSDGGYKSFAEHRLNTNHAFLKCLNDDEHECNQPGCSVTTPPGQDGQGHYHHINGQYNVRVIRINKKFYLYSTESCYEETEGKPSTHPLHTGVLFGMNAKYNKKTKKKEYYSCGRMNDTTKIVTWH